MDEKAVIKALNLKPLPGEGGYFRETHRAGGSISEGHLGGRHQGDRNFSTAIYYLITPSEFSALHRLPQDEVFHFYLGDPAEIIQITPSGEMKMRILGPKILNGQHLQLDVPGGHWQGLRVREGGHWSLLGATVAPGFDFRDFVLADREKLLREFPKFRDEILRLTR